MLRFQGFRWEWPEWTGVDVSIARVEWFGDKDRKASLRWFGHAQRSDSGYRMLNMELPVKRKSI